MEIEDIIYSTPNWEEDIQELLDLRDGIIDGEEYSCLDELKDELDYEMSQGNFD